MEAIRHATNHYSPLPMMTISTERVILRKRLEDLAGARPDLCMLVSYPADGSAEYLIPEKWIRGNAGNTGNEIEKHVNTDHPLDEEITLQDLERIFEENPLIKKIFMSYMSFPKEKRAKALRRVLYQISTWEIKQ